MGIKVTVYNDDAHGRDIQVHKINPFSGETMPHRVQKAEEGDDSKCQQYNLLNGEMLIITTAEKE